MKTGLVLEGGGMRGVFTGGVLDVFLERELSFDACFGVSAGAGFACSYLAGQKQRGYQVVADYIGRKEYCSLYSLLRTGDLFGAEFIYHTIPEKLYPIDNAAFGKNPTEFFSVVTNCETGTAEYHRVTDLFTDVDIVRASSSLPLVSRMVSLSGAMYLDGGIADPIPVKQAFSHGCERVVAVLTRPREYRKGKERFSSLLRTRYRHYPALVRALQTRAEKYNQTLEWMKRKEREGSLFVISPANSRPLAIRRTEKDKEKLRAGYQIGKETAEDAWNTLASFLAG